MDSLKRLDKGLTWLVKKILALGVVFDSDRWVLTTVTMSIADKPVVFDWPKMTGSTKQYEAINLHYIDVLKCFAATLMLGMAGHNSPATIATKIVWLRKFFRDLQSEGLDVITKVGAADLTRNLMRNHFSLGGVTKSTLLSRIRILKQVHKVRFITGYGFLTDPMDRKEISCALRKAKAAGYWEAPPEPMCIGLLRAAIDFLTSHSRNILNIYSLYVDAVEYVANKDLIAEPRMSRSVVDIIGSDDYRKLLTSIDEASEWKANSRSLSRLINHVSAACFIVIIFTCGPRISELRRATSTSVKPRKHLDGKEYFYYFAPRSKTRYSAGTNFSDGLNAVTDPWLLCPAAVDAFSTLTLLTAAGRRKSGIDSLWLATGGSTLFPSEPKSFSILSASRMNVRMNEFATFIRLPANEHWQGLFHSHMGRKHLARFIAKRDRSALGDLALQYSHISAESIDISYARPDSEFRRMVQEELHAEMGMVAQELLKCEPSTIFSTAHETAEGRIGSFLGRLQSSKDIKLLISSGIILTPCQWGVCLYRQETSACEGSATHPNPVNREPDVCASCSNFMATPKHNQWWQEYRQDSIKILAQRNIPAQLREILSRRIIMAESILKVVEVGND